MVTPEASQYLTEKGIRVASKTLEVWRCKSRGPKYKKVGSRVYYERRWLDEFITGLEVKFFDPAKM
jgi:hypothetical protein